MIKLIKRLDNIEGSNVLVEDENGTRLWIDIFDNRGDLVWEYNKHSFRNEDEKEKNMQKDRLWEIENICCKVIEELEEVYDNE